MGGLISKPPPRPNVYADHPFNLLETPISKLPPGSKTTVGLRGASAMVHVHNMIMRGLNSIYLQAPHITPADINPFANYMYQWWRLLQKHHDGEEAFAFPAIERLTGEPCMTINVEQHRCFHDGLDAFEKYALKCIANPKNFKGLEVLRIIDSFGEALEKHLNEEIPTILGLDRFGEEKMAPLDKVFEEEAKNVLGSLGFTTGLPVCALNYDRHYENDIWLHTFPEGPGMYILAFVRRVTFWVHPSWWKFAACDRSGTMQRLYAANEKDTMLAAT